MNSEAHRMEVDEAMPVLKAKDKVANRTQLAQPTAKLAGATAAGSLTSGSGSTPGATNSLRENNEPKRVQTAHGESDRKDGARRVLREDMRVQASGNLKTKVPGKRRRGRPRLHQIPVGLRGIVHKVDFMVGTRSHEEVHGPLVAGDLPLGEGVGMTSHP
ncbi:unnamed protein product [Prorocentrum cordatum]|uniref:Uncharacterized protein n=1 Tax=Prorocentrum cordatum TaxID=2364126 RepID=A0ABN9PZW6_9DINO|nr:unnamed protein product [Polarella glacialis]